MRDAISEIVAAHDDARVIGAQKTRGGFGVVSLVDILALGLKANGECFELAGHFRHERNQQR